MQRVVDMSPPNGTVIQMMPRGHASMGYAHYFMWDSSSDAAVLAWLEGLIEKIKTQPVPVAAPTEVLDKSNEVVAQLPVELSDHDKALCTCGHIRRAHANFILDCCEGACKCGAFEAVA